MKFLFFCLIVPLLLISCNGGSNSHSRPDGSANDTIFPFRLDSFTIKGERNYVDGYASKPGGEGSEAEPWVYVVVEIPTGSTEKWEVDKKTGLLKWEFVDGKPRQVQYLGYPGNYGMVPGTMQSKEKGGDGDPLDVLVLGPPLERGEVVIARAVGVLKLLDRGEKDDKIIAVKAKTPFVEVDDLDDLNKKFPGVLEIVEIWFTKYKGPGKMKSLGYGNKAEAWAILEPPVSPEDISKELEAALDEKED